MLLLLVFLLEATVAILFFAYTDKVRPPVCAHPRRPAQGHEAARVAVWKGRLLLSGSGGETPPSQSVST